MAFFRRTTLNGFNPLGFSFILNPGLNPDMNVGLDLELKQEILIFFWKGSSDNPPLFFIPANSQRNNLE